jgi:uncharacterized protein YjdB
MKKLFLFAAAAMVASVAFVACENNDPTDVAVTGVTLNKRTMALTVGGEETLTATVAPAEATDKSYTWETSAPAIATVTDGVVKAIAPGTATITVKTTNGGFTDKCEVTVSAAGTPVTGVTLNKETLALTVGGEETLTATVAPTDATDQTVRWESTAPTIASVEGGLVKALAPGTATIKVITNEGGHEATCAVNVTAASVPVTGIAIDKETLSLAKGQTATLTAIVAPTNATNQDYTWSTSDPTVATVENGVITPVGRGTATIKATTAQGPFDDACEVTVEGVLLNGLVWADCNVGQPGEFTTAPEIAGLVYKWGSKIGWTLTTPPTSTAGATSWNNTNLSTASVWPADQDPCPTGWRMPTMTEFSAIVSGRGISKATDQNTITKWEPLTLNEMLVVKVTDLTNENLFIYLPCNGRIVGGNANGALQGVLTTGSTASHSWYWMSNNVKTDGTNTTDGCYANITRSAAKADGSPMMTIDTETLMTSRISANSVRCVKTVE